MKWIFLALGLALTIALVFYQSFDSVKDLKEISASNGLLRYEGSDWLTHHFIHEAIYENKKNVVTKIRIRAFDLKVSDAKKYPQTGTHWFVFGIENGKCQIAGW